MEVSEAKEIFRLQIYVAVLVWYSSPLLQHNHSSCVRKPLLIVILVEVVFWCEMWINPVHKNRDRDLYYWN